MNKTGKVALHKRRLKDKKIKERSKAQQQAAK